MRFKIPVYTLLILELVLLLSSSCKKDIPATIPQVSTTEARVVFSSSATVGGNVLSDGRLDVVRGICWSKNQSPTTADNITKDGSGVGIFATTLTGLTSNTTYYFCAYATNNIGTSYGSILSFTTGQTTVNDIDGNGYDIVTIGSQIWMVQNLKVTHYRNGDTLPNITDNNQWYQLTSGAYCNYNNDTSIAKIYGRLYNGYAICDSRNICPEGWHIPSYYEWSKLEIYLGKENAGGKMKEAGRKHWQNQFTWADPYKDATNESGFSALPGSDRDMGGRFFDLIGYAAIWWVSTESVFVSPLIAGRRIINESPFLYSQYDFYPPKQGLSVRCLKD
jgi:uncharacterized protein (TIGR02145 family)